MRLAWPASTSSGRTLLNVRCSDAAELLLFGAFKLRFKRLRGTLDTNAEGRSFAS